MAAIQRLCDRVIWLNAGHIANDGDPETVVTQYETSAWTLTAGSAKRGRKGDHANEHGEIVSVRLLSAEGREIGAVRTDEELNLTVLFSLLTPGMTGRCVVSLMTRGVVAFRTAQPEDVRVATPGMFAASVRIPAHLLADTIYTVKVGILVHANGQESTLVQDNALTFRVYADEDRSHKNLLNRNVYHGAAWAGAVMPRLDWQVSRRRDIEPASVS
jgi:lipopolysaccharide transport system ATP-binding protein